MVSEEEYKALVNIKNTHSSKGIKNSILISLIHKYFIEIYDNKILEDGNVVYNFRLTTHGEYMIKYYESKNQ